MGKAPESTGASGLQTPVSEERNRQRIPWAPDATALEEKSPHPDRWGLFSHR